MEPSGVDGGGFYGNGPDVISRQSPPTDRAGARQLPCNYYAQHSEQVVEDESVQSTKPYACADCRYATDRKNNLRRHRATMHERCDRALECCGLTFVSKSELREHVTEHHGAGAGYACAECGRRFGRRALMRRHAAVHDARPTSDDRRRRSKGVVAPLVGRRYACGDCDYTTAHKSNLDRHLRRHAGLRSAAAGDRQSAFVGGGRYLPLNADHADDSSDLSMTLNGCCCHICVNALYHRRTLPSYSPLTSPSHQAPFPLNFLPPRLEDMAWSFRKPILPDFDTRRPWSLHAGLQGPSTDANRDSRNIVDHLSTWKDTDNQLRPVDALHRGRPGDLTKSSTHSTGDNVLGTAANVVADSSYSERRRAFSPFDRCADSEQLVVVDGPRRRSPSLTESAEDDARDSATTTDVTGTCSQQRRRRLRLLPLLHTCRSCSLTFVSQLQLKFHSDLFHRATDLDVAAARPISCRATQLDDSQS